MSEPDAAIVKQLAMLEEEAFGRGGLNEWHLVPLIRHGRVFILRSSEKEIIGTVQYILDWDEPKKAYLFGISIAKPWRGQGLGNALLTQSITALQSELINMVELTVDPSNTAAVRLYEQKLGFTRGEYQENEYGAGEHRLAMTLVLHDSQKMW